ncbi:MAG TPA: class II aldolase/adducin family protein [Thermoleophilaceae bacterium]|nr:class II aldolase/adducin family protein [Thermoleophilaceae bacterium]
MSLRTEIVAAAHEMLRLGLVAGSSGNVSAREGDSIVITPTGLPYRDLTEDDLVTLSADGELLEGRREPSSERRVHLAVYAARPDAGALVHTHSVHATAWSFLGEPLDTGTEELALAAGGAVRTARFAETATDEIARACVDALGESGAVLMARHGVLALGGSPARALDAATVVERQAHIAWLLRGERDPLHTTPWH